MSPLRRLLCLVVGAFVLLAPSVAVADEQVVEDRARDVIRLSWTGDCGIGPCQQHRTIDREHRIGDIVWSRAVYRHRRLVLTLKVRDMTSAAPWATYVGWDIRKPDGEDIGAQILYSSGHKSFDIGGTDGYRCDADQGEVERQRLRYALSIPARCLGGAPWVRVSATVMVTGRGQEWRDVAGRGPHIKLRYQVPDPAYGRRILRG